MLLLGSTWSAEQALAFGLVTQVFPPEELAAGAQSVVESLSVGVSVRGLEDGKRALREHSGLSDLSDKYRSAEAYMAVAMSTTDAVEGTKAMLEQRQPRFIS
jgi:enoyl-CoA hydratase